MDDLNFREILVKKPFFRIKPNGYHQHGEPSNDINRYGNTPNDPLWKVVVTQADFIREYYPSAHQIFDPITFPDITRTNPETGETTTQLITRTAFAFQQVIATKHTMHMTGNDVQFEIAEGDEDINKADEMQEDLLKFKKGWLTKNIEMAHFEAVWSYMVTADAAVVGFIDKGTFGVKSLSYINGDTLYPHFNSITGELSLFARKYYDYDEEGVNRIEWVEVWDEKYLRRFKKDLKGNKLVSKIKEIFGITGYEPVSIVEHGFNFVPVTYVRNDDGPCWSGVQQNIEDYEEAFAYLSESNKAYGFPIFYIKGDGDSVSLQGDMNGAVKAVVMNDTESDAGFLNGTDASSAFATQLNKNYELIYELSFTVKPPELKSGDLPGVAIKLLFSPAIEVAIIDAQKMSKFLDTLVRIAKFGIGSELNMTASMVNLPINAWVEPYVHQNDTELITNLSTAVQNGFLSRQTASERNSKYSKNDEFARCIREKKEEHEQDLLFQIEQMEEQTQNDIEQKEAEMRMNKQKGGNDINTGRGAGRPNKSGKKWDKNGNNDIDDRNNWKDWNNKH